MPTQPPRTEDDLRRLHADGLLNETTRLEFKSPLPGNKSLAEEIAALAYLGGTLILGVADTKAGASVEDRLQPLADPERVEEKVANLCVDVIDPSLGPETRIIPAAEGAGYVVVDVEQSPQRPHTVDGRFLWRTGTRKATMTHDQVRLVHQQLLQRQAGIGEAMMRWKAELPPQADDAQHGAPAGTTVGMMRIVADPLTPTSRRMALDAWKGEPWSGDRFEFFRRMLAVAWQRTDGAFSAFNGSAQRAAVQALSERFGYAHTLRIGEDDSVRAAFLATQWLGGYRRLRPETLRELRRTLVLVATLAEAMAYSGNWVLAVEFDGLEGVSILDGGQMTTKVLEGAETASGQAEVSSRDLRARPGHWTEDLAGELFRWTNNNMRGADEAFVD